jgi:hypothetical protein
MRQATDPDAKVDRPICGPQKSEEIFVRANKQTVVALAAGSMLVTGIGVSAAASSSTTHTVKFISKQTSNKTIGGGSVETDKDVSHGKQIGSDLVTSKLNASQTKAVGDIAVGLNGGQIYAHFTFDTKTEKLAGKVTGGTGAYKGDGGTITGTPAGGQNENLTIKYHS